MEATAIFLLAVIADLGLAVLVGKFIKTGRR